MIIVELSYKVTIDVLEQRLLEHRNFLEQYYQQGYFLASGPKIPRTGGIIIALTTDLDELKQRLADDPFYIHDYVEYRYTPFTAVKYHPAIQELIAR